MKRKTKVILAAVAGVATLTGLIFHTANEKKAYDYSAYYKEVEKPIENVEVDEEEKEPEKVLSLTLLKETNPDVIAIIEFDDRVIYEPIVQAPDNEFYVRKNIDLKYAAAGIPFVSYDGNIYSRNVVVYGHSSKKSNIIFTPLMNYLDESYYKEHPKFHFETEGEKRIYEIFSVFNYDTTNLDDLLEFTQSTWRKTSDYESFITQIKQKSLYKTDVEVTASDNLMTLVTCDTRNGSKRVVVMAKLVQKENI